MDLKTYIDFKKIKVADAAEQLKITRAHLYAVLAGTYPPGRKLALKIVEWSDNAITFNDLWKKDRNGVTP